ncbi:ABC transporter ATP-binding protein [Iodobacter ciconiae]|nr:ABC transporter ATP-binding protein [Iodobacter ciconiae]
MSHLSIRSLLIKQGERPLCTGLNLEVNRGESWLILGENGCGKSTLLATLAAWLKPAAGEIHLNKQSFKKWSGAERAKEIAWLNQQDDCPFPLSVIEKILSGRHPHLSHWNWESSDDLRLADEQLARLDISHLKHRDLATLSGGERRRVSLAAALAQQAPLILLDEPLSQLDLRHQQQALSVLREENQAGRTLLMVSHDPNHAHQASHVLLMFGNGQWLAGPTIEIMTSKNLSALYRTEIRSTHIEGQEWFMPQPR